MKDAFGGTFMLNIMIIFFVVFISFMTVAITITKTFRVKSDIVSYLTRNDINPNQLKDKEETIGMFLDNIKYKYKGKVALENDCRNKSGRYIDGVCIVPVIRDNVYYYKVYSYIYLDFPLFHFNSYLSFVSESKPSYFG